MTRVMTIGEIDRLISEGASVNAIEALLESLPIEPDERSALWLKAWLHNEGRRRPSSLPGHYLG